MALYTTLASLSKTASSNAADGATDAPSTIDQQTNLLASFIAQLRDGEGFTAQLGSRNRLINGNFVINQRGVSGSVVLAPGAYGHDRWKAGAAGCTYTFSTIGLDTTITISSGSMQQVVEGLNIEGGTYTMSWAGTAQGKINAGAYSASGVQALSIAAGVDLVVEFNSGSLSKVQLEPNNTVSQFERRPAQYELFLAQRYYESGDGRLGGYGQAGIGNFMFVPFKVPKRAPPSVVYSVSAATNVSVFDARDATTLGLLWYCQNAATGGFVWIGSWTASAEL